MPDASSSSPLLCPTTREGAKCVLTSPSLRPATRGTRAARSSPWRTTRAETTWNACSRATTRTPRSLQASFVRATVFRPWNGCGSSLPLAWGISATPSAPMPTDRRLWRRGPTVPRGKPTCLPSNLGCPPPTRFGWAPTSTPGRPRAMPCRQGWTCGKANCLAIGHLHMPSLPCSTPPNWPTTKGPSPNSPTRR